MAGPRRHYAFPRRRGDNITLIGMPGSGKSTLGRRAARLLSREFVDTDNVLASLTGVASTAELSKSTDFAGFVREEERAVRSLTPSRTIIATGGSVIYSARGMRHLQKLGPIIYLEQPLELIESRVHLNPRRGVILKDNQTFEDLYHARHKLYRRYADMEFFAETLDIKTSARLLVALIHYMEAERERLYAKETHRSN